MQGIYTSCDPRNILHWHDSKKLDVLHLVKRDYLARLLLLYTMLEQGATTPIQFRDSQINGGQSQIQNFLTHLPNDPTQVNSMWNGYFLDFSFTYIHRTPD